MKTIQEIHSRIRAEYIEMPGMKLTAEQVQRLCGIERHVCTIVLKALVDEKFLCLRPSGHYARLSDGDVRHPGRPRAALKTAKAIALAS